jgi:hypothetical protein
MKTIQTTLFCSLFLLYCITSCNHSERLTSAQIEKLKSTVTGNWLNADWLDSIQLTGSPAQTRHISCMEIIVSAGLDSVAWLEPGQALQVYPVELQNDSSFKVKTNDRMLLFYYSADLKTLLMKDGEKIIRLKKLPPRYAVLSVRGWMSGLTLFMNEDLLAGEYRLIDETDKKTYPCVFTSYGEVKGLAGYKFYKLCLAGDCLQQSAEDVITLSDEKSSDRYIWKWEKDTLRFYSVRNTGTLEKPVLVAHEKFFEMVKK